MVETVGVGGDVQDSGSDEGLETKRLRSEYFIRSASQIAIYFVFVYACRACHHLSGRVLSSMAAVL